MNLGILLAIGLLFTSVVTGHLDVLPLNTAVVAGNTYVLYCAKPIEAVVVNILWWDPSGRTIVSNNKSAKGYDVMYDRYRGHSTMKSLFSVMSHSGLFECRASYNESVHSGFAQLIVLDDYQLRCVQTSTIVVEGDEIEAVCDIGYAGEWAPLLEWSGVSDDMMKTEVANETDDTMARYRLFVYVHEGMSDRFHCTGRFDQPKYPLPENHATNHPSIKFKPCYVQFIVHFPPTTERIQISPIKDFYDVGELITCDAETNPRAINIIWRDVNGGIISQTGQFTAGQLGVYHYDCEVTNVVGEPKEEKTVTASKNFRFRVGPPTTTIAHLESGVFSKRGRRRMVVTGGLAFVMVLHDGYSRAIMLAITTWLGKESSLVIYTLPIWLVYFVFKRLYENT